ncbi:MAG: hypothetical protein DHS20C18_02700 [Saprospiraceae bacterium]|nr:MAG: hypothetical protein DHS20C18_02700 [Saprospiraceae bacterium]
MEFLHFIGRFHPLVLHLPIGFLLMGVILEWWSRRTNNAQLRPAVGISLLATMVSAIFTAGLGYFLSLEGGYSGTILDWHKWLGFAFAVSSIVLYWLHQNRIKTDKKQAYFFPFLLFSVLLMSVAGHYGGMLTHGSDFLTENAPSPIKKLLGQDDPDAVNEMDLSELDSAVVFTNFIQPILKAKCTSCHNPGKLKGELLLHSIEGIKKGGENGAVFVAHKPDESPMTQRIRLPKEAEEHMPPDGKKQVTEEELALLEWWVEQGADFGKKVGECEQPEKIRTILEAKVKPPNGIYALNISKISDRKLAAIQDEGIPLFAVSRESPFLEADFSAKKDINPDQLRKLKKSSDQLIQLDLSRSNCTDEMLAEVKNLPHLTHLNLSKTKITNKGIKHLQGLKYLEYLNLYDTGVNDSCLVVIQQMPGLQRLYLWNTQISKEGIAQLQQQMPTLMINNGEEDDPTFASAQLKPPMILTSKTLFSDTVNVNLKLNFSGAKFYYTLDGSDPDTNSILYTKPFTLDQTATVKTISHKPGWSLSKVNEQQFIKVKYQAKVVNLTTPNEKYAGKGAETLTDFSKGTLVFLDGAWLGYEKKHLETVLDLGAPKEVSRITVSALEDSNSWIFFPKGLRAWVSKDGKNYQPVLSKTFDGSTEPNDPRIQNFSEAFATTTARFVKVKIESALTTPPWHAAPGQPCWLFVDEVLVE